MSETRLCVEVHCREVLTIDKVFRCGQCAMTFCEVHLKQHLDKAYQRHQAEVQLMRQKAQKLNEIYASNWRAWSDLPPAKETPKEEAK